MHSFFCFLCSVGIVVSRGYLCVVNVENHADHYGMKTQQYIENTKVLWGERTKNAYINLPLGSFPKHDLR